MSAKKKNIFGLTIRNLSLIAIEIEASKNKAKVVNYSKVNLEPLVVADNCNIMKPEKFKEALRKLLTEAKKGPIKTKSVIISIPEEKTFSHQVEIPKENENDEKSIKRIARDYVPIELNEAIVDYYTVKNYSQDKSIMNLNFVAVQKNIILPLIETLKEAGLEVLGVDIDRNSLIRFCNNNLHPNKGDFMVVNIGPEASMLSILGPSGTPYTIEMKAGMDIMMMQTSDTMTLVQKGVKLKKIVENQEPLELKTIYLMGTHPNMGEIKGNFKAELPGVEVLDEPDYIIKDKEVNWEYTETIGLALKSITTEAAGGEINLVTADIKEKLEARRMEPVLKRYFFIIYILIVGGALFSSVMVVENYLNYKISAQEIEVYADKASNPYLTETARATNERLQMQQQIETILADQISIIDLIEKFEEYNTENVKMQSMNYSMDMYNNHTIKFQAKVIDRESTEELLTKLDEDYYFKDINSPLENLTKKGERTVNIDMTLDMNSIMAAENPPEEEIIQEETEGATGGDNTENETTPAIDEGEGVTENETPKPPQTPKTPSKPDSQENPNTTDIPATPAAPEENNG